MRFWRLAIVLLILSVQGMEAAVAAAPETTIEVTPFFEGRFRAGQWLPVRVTVTNDGPDRRAVVRLGTDTGPTYDAEVELPRGARKALVLYARPEGFARNIKARIVDGDQELASTTAKVQSWPVRAQVIGTLSAFPLTPPELPSTDQSPVVMAQLKLEDLAPRVEGLQSFSGLVIDGVELANISPEQSAALSDWVRMGGQLVVGAGENDRLIESLPQDLRSATRGAVGDQAVDQTVLAELGPGTTVKGAALTPANGATAIDALTVQKEWGRGRVTILGFSLSDPALQHLPPQTALWGSLINLRRFDPNVPPDTTPDDMQSQQLGQALFTLPALALPPLNMLAGLLIAYIILIGPALYLVLWRLDRLAWAWVAIPALTLLFSAGAYGYGLRIRGNDVILNQISVVQPLGDRARVRSFAGIFSPVARSYDVSVGADALTRPLFVDGRVFERPGGAGSVSGPTTAGRFLQGSSGVRNLPVGQWTMNTFGAEALVPFGKLAAQVELGDGLLTATVRNSGAVTLRNVALIYGNQAKLIGDIAPGAEQGAEMRIDNSFGPNVQSLAMTLFKDRWNPQMGPPPELRLPIQMIETLYGSSPWSAAPRPTVIGWLDESPLPLRVDTGRIQHQKTTLVEIPAELSYAQQLTLPRGWVRPEFANTRLEEGSCVTQWGAGQVLMSSDTITATLRFPPVMQDFKVTKATIFSQLEGPPPARGLVEVYDWNAAQWTKQSETLGTTDLSDPARFVHDRQMQVRLKFDGTVMRGGCVHVGASVGGTR